jgi:hypothetical protein
MPNFTMDVPALQEINKVLEKIAEDDLSAAKGTKAALRRVRVQLSALAKLCKQARIEVLAKMNAKQS